MDIAFHIARWALPLNLLIGHRPSREQRAEEREVCLRIARGGKFDSDDLDVAYLAARGAWGGGLIVSLGLSWLFLDLADSVHPGFDLPGIAIMFVMGLCLSLLLIHQSRDWMLEHTEDADPDARTGRIAARLSRPRAYDFWLAAAASVWPALWGAGVV
ncbi:hypothetical protein I3215_31185 [Streptomyces sp. RB110-1]|uniref:hypothetical protein n=1 Tax=unclassified Streptomyces TaxID=2593676 RepID=UPI0019006CD1|nr:MULTISPECIES: hypothetical protein [unclassified Streptomyces]MBK0377280.1 hypothetical protein [Streptomyces sp. RB110-1]MBK0386348.1 hypothetical protein [Streptomyces sp. RB110-2]